MSHRHIRVLKPPPRRRRWLEISACVAFLLVVILYWVARADGWFVPDYTTTTGQVLDTRIVVPYAIDAPHGGQIYYRLEAHVQYRIPDGNSAPGASVPQDRWLTASETTTTRELLLMKQEKHSETCQVYWLPEHPETAKCRFV